MAPGCWGWRGGDISCDSVRAMVKQLCKKVVEIRRMDDTVMAVVLA